MGSALSGIFGGGQEQSTEQTLDPTTQALNRMRLGQLQGLFGETPLSNYGQPQPDIFTASPAVNDLFQQANAAPDLSNLMSLQQYIQMGLDEGSNFISQVATPEIMQQAALQGLEGGGYVPEAIARATAGIAMPFLQNLPGASATLTETPARVRGLNAQTASTLMPLADYQGGLNRLDFGRQQSVALAGLTGIPYQASVNTTQDQSQQPFFNFFGQG